MVPARTPMGLAASGSRLDRLNEGQRIVWPLSKTMTQRQIASATGIHKSSITEFKLGRRAPSAHQLAALRELVMVIRGDEIESGDRQGVVEVGCHRS